MTPEQQPSTPISQEQMLAMLQTRGFESGFQTTPLRDFWGDLVSITGEMRQGQRGAFAVSLYNYEGVEVIYSTEPYNNPSAQIEIPTSSRDKSKMGYWGTSIDAIINAGVDKSLGHGDPRVKNQGYLVGKRLHVAMTPGHPIPNRNDATGQWEDRPTDCWVLLEVSGEGTATAPASTRVVGAPPAQGGDVASIALGLLNGRTINQWHQEVFGNLAVKSDAKLVLQIISGEFIGGLEAAGKIVKGADGVYTVVS